MSTQLHRGSTEPDNDATNILQKHLFYTDIDQKIHTFINISTSILNVTWKLTKNCSHMISDRLSSSYSLYSGNNQWSKLNVESSSIPLNHIELFYPLPGRLLFTSKITRPGVLGCVTYVLMVMELPIICYNNRNLNTDLMFTKKTRVFILLHTEDQCDHFDTLFSKHKNYILIILQ